MVRVRLGFLAEMGWMQARFGLAACCLGICLAAHAQPPTNNQSGTANRVATDRLLDALKVAPDEQSAVGLEGQLEQMWLNAGSPAVTLLLSRGMRSLQAGQDSEAVDSFSDAITLQPDMAEAWHQRALARYHTGDINWSNPGSGGNHPARAPELCCLSHTHQHLDGAGRLERRLRGMAEGHGA